MPVTFYTWIPSTRCIDVMSTSHPGKVDLFDCKPQDSNQVWTFDCASGAGAFAHEGRCLALN